VSRRVPMLMEYKGGYYKHFRSRNRAAVLGDARCRTEQQDGAHSPEGLTGSATRALYQGKLHGLEGGGSGKLRIPVDDEVAALVLSGSARQLSVFFARHSVSVEKSRWKVERQICANRTSAPSLVDLRSAPSQLVSIPGRDHATSLRGCSTQTRITNRSYMLGASPLVASRRRA